MTHVDEGQERLIGMEIKLLREGLAVPEVVGLLHEVNSSLENIVRDVQEREGTDLSNLTEVNLCEFYQDAMQAYATSAKQTLQSVDAETTSLPATRHIKKERAEGTNDVLLKIALENVNRMVESVVRCSPKFGPLSLIS